MLTRLDVLLRQRVPARPVAFTRMMLGLALVLVSIESAAVLHGIAGGRLAYPFFDWVPRPPEILPMAVLALGWITGVLLILGVFPSLMAGAGALTGLVTLLWDQQTYSSHLVLLVILLFLLVWLEPGQPRGATWRRHRPEQEVPFWPELLMMTQVTVVYLFAGLSKMQPTFLSGDPLAGWMWADLPHWAYVVLAWMTVITEVGLAFALWVPRTRVLAVLVGVVLHLSISIMLDAYNLWLLAFALTTTATYPLFLTRPPLRAPLSPRPPGSR